MSDGQDSKQRKTLEFIAANATYEVKLSGNYANQGAVDLAVASVAIPAQEQTKQAQEQTKQSGWATLQLAVATGGTIGAAILAPNYAPWVVLAGLGGLIIHKGFGLLHVMIENRRPGGGVRVTPHEKPGGPLSSKE